MQKKIGSVRIESHIDEVDEELKEKVQNWLEAVGADAASTAANISSFPVDTGRLRNSISYVTKTKQDGMNSHSGEKAKKKDYSPHGTPEDLAVYIGTNVSYAPYQEFGTSRGVTGHHFLQFGCTAHMQEYKQKLENILKE